MKLVEIAFLVLTSLSLLSSNSAKASTVDAIENTLRAECKNIYYQKTKLKGFTAEFKDGEEVPPFSKENDFDSYYSHNLNETFGFVLVLTPDDKNANSEKTPFLTLAARRTSTYGFLNPLYENFRLGVLKDGKYSSIGDIAKEGSNLTWAHGEPSASIYTPSYLIPYEYSYYWNAENKKYLLVSKFLNNGSLNSGNFGIAAETSIQLTETTVKPACRAGRRARVGQIICSTGGRGKSFLVNTSLESNFGSTFNNDSYKDYVVRGFVVDPQSGKAFVDQNTLNIFKDLSLATREGSNTEALLASTYGYVRANLTYVSLSQKSVEPTLVFSQPNKNVQMINQNGECVFKTFSEPYTVGTRYDFFLHVNGSWIPDHAGDYFYPPRGN